MLILIHGEDIVASRRKLSDLLSTVPQAEIIRLSDKTIDEETLKQACESSSLFADKRVVVIESVFSLKSPKLKDAVLGYLAKGDYAPSIVVWHDKSVDSRIVTKYFKSGKVFHFPYPKLLFTFLDAVGTKPGKDVISLFHKVTETQDPGLVYAMLLRQLRILIIARDLGPRGFSPTQKWQMEKTIRQAQGFSLEQLILLYRQLYAIDYKIKSGETPLSYKELIDIWLCNI